MFRMEDVIHMHAAPHAMVAALPVFHQGQLGMGRN
jgi:hypothetical protein